MQPVLRLVPDGRLSPLQHLRRDLFTTVGGQTVQNNVLGLASIARDVTPDLARATITSVSVLGTLQASAEVRTALADRMH